jgi:RNA polymerase sigma-70 factor, ECF subfamily
MPLPATTVDFEGLTDAELLTLARHDHTNAFGRLVQRHRRMCLNVARSLLRNLNDAEDEVQNAFFQAYEHLDQYREEAQFSTWLSRIVVNQCLMALRRRQRARFAYLDELAADGASSPTEIASRGEDPEGALGAAEVADVLRAEIRRLPPLFRSVLVLRDLKQVPLSDAAEQLGITAPAARSRLMRARLELRNRLSRRHTWLTCASVLRSRAAPLQKTGRRCALGQPVCVTSAAGNGLHVSAFVEDQA